MNHDNDLTDCCGSIVNLKTNGFLLMKSLSVGQQHTWCKGRPLEASLLRSQVQFIYKNVIKHKIKAWHETQNKTIDLTFTQFTHSSYMK